MMSKLDSSKSARKLRGTLFPRLRASRTWRARHSTWIQPSLQKYSRTRHQDFTQLVITFATYRRAVHLVRAERARANDDAMKKTWTKKTWNKSESPSLERSFSRESGSRVAQG